MTSIPRGRFCWYELMTTDPRTAEEFYAAVAGWGTEEWQGSDPPYTLWKNGPTALGGLMELPEEAAAAGVPPHWIAYVSTPDFDASLQEARATGAELVWGPRSLPGVGRFAGVRDPQGAMFALYEPAGEAPGHDGVAGPGEFSWHELATSDWEQAWRFYAARRRLDHPVSGSAGSGVRAAPGGVLSHSPRMAVTGSTRVARSAGTRLATTATAARTLVTIP